MRCVRILNSCIFNSGREGGRDEGIKVRNMIKEELLFRENDHNNPIGLPRLGTEVRSCDGAVTQFLTKERKQKRENSICRCKSKISRNREGKRKRKKSNKE